MWTLRVVCSSAPLFLLVLMAATTARAQTTAPDPKDILDRLDSTLSAQPTCAIRGTIQLQNGGTFADIATDRAELKYTYFRDGDRFDIAVQTFKPGDSPNEPADQGRSIVGTEQGIFYSWERNHPPLEVVVRPDLKRARQVARSRLQGAEAMDGYVAQDFASLVEILRESETRVEPGLQPIDGHDCIVIHSNGTHGQYTAFLDPAIGYLPRKVEVLKAADNIFNDEKLSAVAFVVADGKSIILMSDDFVMDQISVERLAGNWIMTGVTTREKQFYSNGKTLNLKRVHHRDQIDVKPDFAKLDSFHPSIPDGTRVLFDDPLETGLAYEWRNGKVLPKVDISEVGGIERSISDYKNAGNVPQNSNDSGKTSAASDVAVSASPWPWLILLLAGSGLSALAISLLVSNPKSVKNDRKAA